MGGGIAVPRLTALSFPLAYRCLGAPALSSGWKGALLRVGADGSGRAQDATVGADGNMKTGKTEDETFGAGGSIRATDEVVGVLGRDGEEDETFGAGGSRRAADEIWHLSDFLR
ncbi:hypothetical protein T484DRAFT_1765907 [Baffinella frigidus]|nr:hypothetical protein T484DRAFT_1765907 [Cryptophyta sp. CCMP2293]